MSPELEAFKECRDKVVSVVSTREKVLSWQLYCAGVITYEVRKKVAGQITDSIEREVSCTIDLVNGIERGIEEEHENLQKFLNVLGKDRTFYHEVICDISKALASKSTIAGKGRPSSLSLPEESENETQVTLTAMRRASVSMVMTKPSIPRNSIFGYPSSKEHSRRLSAERRQIYQRLRRESVPLPEEPAAKNIPNVVQQERHSTQSITLSPVSTIGTRFVPKKLVKHTSLTDAAGITQKLVETVSMTQDPLLSSSASKPFILPLNSEPLSMTGNKAIVESKSRSSAMSPTSQLVVAKPLESHKDLPASKALPSLTLTLQPALGISTSPKNELPSLQPFHGYKSGVNSPADLVLETPSGTPSSEAEAMAPVASGKEEAVFPDSMRTTSEQSLLLESCGSSSEDDETNESLLDDLQRIRGELKEVQRKQKHKRRFHRLRERLLRSRVEEKERIIQQFEIKIGTLQEILHRNIQDKTKSEADEREELKKQVADLQKELFTIKKGNT